MLSFTAPYATLKIPKLPSMAVFTEFWVIALSACFRNDSIDIIEMVGLLDYIPDKLAIKIMKSIYQTLKSGGVFIVSNVMPNPEMPFVEKTIKWEGLIYRQKEQLIELVIQSGFSPGLSNTLTEPQRIHTIAISKKESKSQ